MNFYLPSNAGQMINITKFEIDKIDDSIQAIKHLLKNKTIDIFITKISPLTFDVGDVDNKKIYSFNHSTWKWMVHKEVDYDDEVEWNWEKQQYTY